jgi:hypothetical protein
MPASGDSAGLSWSWELDFDALARCIGDDSSSEAGLADEEAAQKAVLDAVEEHGGERIPAGALAGRIAGHLPPGPDLAAWLATAPAAGLKDRDLAAVAGSWRRIASWAQAQELAAVAQIASRAAARDEDIGTDASGRPAQVPVSAIAEVSLELTMSQFSASWWTDLAVDLGWRLAATGAALAAGTIDLSRARLIVDATRLLSDAAARAVQEKVLPAAGDMTTGTLRAALRRAAIAADPEGAERRRKQAERQAKVSLHPDEEGTAALSGQRLPAIHATAAMARIKAMARALKASGAPGGMDLLCAQIYLGLLLGTLPLIPPAEGAPPGDPSGHDSHDARAEGPPSGNPGGGGPGRGRPGGSPGSGAPAGSSAGDRPGGPSRGKPAGDGGQRDNCQDETYPMMMSRRPGIKTPPAMSARARKTAWPGAGGMTPAWMTMMPDGRTDGDWPDVPAAIPPAFAPPAFARPGDGRPGDGRPAGGQAVSGMLDVSMPWRTLAGICPEPGRLGRIGPVTAIQARQLAERASRNPAAEWRIIVTTSGGQAIAVTRLRCPRQRDGPADPGAGLGLVSRVTLTIPEDLLAQPPPGWRGPDPPGGILARALQAAEGAADRARASATADAAAGGCAHGSASSAYRPPPRLKEYVAARDLTCRSPVCRQPAWRGDLDHTIPFDKGGLTCRCNLGGLCRTHHLLKHHPDWKLEQRAPGAFTWTTPSGRTFTTTPDVYPV